MRASNPLDRDQYFRASAEATLNQFCGAISDPGMPGHEDRVKAAEMIVSLERPKTDEEFKIFVAVIRRKLKQCYQFAVSGGKRRERRFRTYPALMEHLLDIEKGETFDYQELYELMDMVERRLGNVIDLNPNGRDLEAIPLSRFKPGGKQRARYTEFGKHRTTNWEDY